MQGEVEYKCWLRYTAKSFVVCFFFADYKQKYGEEHGSCQAGIAGVFTEVSGSAFSMFISSLPLIHVVLLCLCCCYLRLLFQSGIPFNGRENT